MKGKLKCLFDTVVYCVFAAIIQGVVSIALGVGYAVYYLIENAESFSTGIVDEGNLMTGILSFISSALGVSSIITVIALVLINKKKDRDMKDFFLVKNPGKNNILICILLGLGIWLATNGIMEFIVNIFNINLDKFQENFEFIEVGNVFITMLTVGILAPIAEEVLFRLIIFKELNKKFTVKWAIIIQGVMFGIYHFNLVQGIYTIFFGILFGYVTYKTKSLIPAIILHCINNSVALMVSFIGVMFTPVTLIISTVIGIVLLVVGIVLLNKNNIMSKDYNEEVLLNQ